MIFPTEQNWTDWEIKEELHKFFLLRWQEIFDGDTFYSWQVRSCNLKTILYEILTSLNIVNKVHNFHPNILFLIEEAKQIVKEDIIISKYFSYIPHYLEKLMLEYNQHIKNIDKFKKLINIIIGNLSDYQDKLLLNLTELISNPPEKYKNEIYSLTMRLGTELKYVGYSTLALRESYHILIDKKNGTFLNRFKKLIEKFSGKKNWYLCYFFISWPGKFPKLTESHIELIKERPENKSSIEENNFYNQDAKATVAKIRVKSLDYYSAQIKAERKLQALFATSILYKPTKKAVIKHNKTLIINEESSSKKYINPDSSLKYIRDARNAENNIAQFWELTERMSSEDVNQLFASLQYHKLALLSPTDEAKLVNLWIAVESLVQQGGKNIINRITEYIPSSVTIGYIYLMMKAIPIDIRNLWKQLDTKTIRSKISKSSEYILHPFDLLTILVDKQHGELIKEFLNLIKDNPLLLYRIGYLSKDTFSKPKFLMERLKKHKKNIEWQIRRIYRARNYVMHKGIYPLKTRQLIQHLHSYYIITIHNLIHDIKMHSEWSISDALEHRCHLYEYFCKKLENNENITVEALFNPQLILFKKMNNSVWDEKIL
jgi:hypothetical protein